jgi:tRNA G18 (ribose-2'-O)-methylase SpoU
MILLLDNVRSKENVGALFRTADGAGVSEVVLAGITPCPVNRFGLPDGKIVKSALGAEASVPWRYAHDALDEVKRLKQDGAIIIVLEQTTTSVDYRSVSCAKGKHTVLVVGNEVEGVSSEVCAFADTILHIPMYGVKESLNVTTATGIALYALRASVVTD